MLNPLVAPLTGPPVTAPRPPQLNPSASLRHAHVLRLHELLQHLLSLEPSRANSTRTLRAWRALAKCKEVDVGALWKLGNAVVERISDGGGDEDDEREEQMARKAAWVKACQDNRLAKVEKTNEYVLSLVAAGRPKDALDELDAVLPAHPYNESITLNVMGGFLALHLAQPPRPRDVVDNSDDSSDSDSSTSSKSSRSVKSSSDEADPKRDPVAAAAKREARKRLRTDSSVDVDKTSLKAHLRSCQSHSPSLFELAKQRFRRAAHLERTEDDSGDSDADEVGQRVRDKGGEGARWLALLDLDLDHRDHHKKRRLQ